MRVGTDILSLKRLRKVFEKYPNRLANKILSTKEQEIYSKISNDQRRVEFLGGRFCGKEAIFKAADVGDLTWRRVSILRNEHNKPVVSIDECTKNEIKISISHEEDYAIATVVIE